MQDFFVCNRAWVESEQSSHRISCILQKFGEIFGLDANSLSLIECTLHSFCSVINASMKSDGRLLFFWVIIQPFSCNVLYSHAGKFRSMSQTRQ